MLAAASADCCFWEAAERAWSSWSMVRLVGSCCETGIVKIVCDVMPVGKGKKLATLTC